MTFLLLALLTGAPEKVPLWVTFDVLNPKRLGGHRILHLEDVVGPRAKSDIPGLSIPRAVLIAATTAEACRRPGSVCAELEQLSKIPGGLVIGVVLVDREGAPRAEREILETEYSFPLTVDTYGVVGQALSLDRPGVCLVVYSNGQAARLVPPSEGSDRSLRERFSASVEAAFREALRRDEEER